MAEHHLTAKQVDRFWSRVDKTNTCWEWRSIKGRNHYGRFHVGGIDYAAHRVAWIITNGPIPTGLFICHHCDNKACVRPDHLFLGTASENSIDASLKGRNVMQSRPECSSLNGPNKYRPKGEEHGASKLTVAAVQFIRSSYPQQSARYLADRFGVHPSSIIRVVSGKLWRHVNGEVSAENDNSLSGRLAKAEAALATLQAQVTALVMKIDECLPAVASASVMSYIHGARYTGPTFGEELKGMFISLGLTPVNMQISEAERQSWPRPQETQG